MPYLSEITFEQYNLNNELHERAAIEASQWSEGIRSMPKFFASDVAKYPLSLFAFRSQTETLGHIAVVRIRKQEDELDEAEVGAMVVDPIYRQQGVGTALIKKLVEIASDALPDVEAFRAYTDYRSSIPFARAGGQFYGYRNPTLKGHGNYITDLSNAVRQARSGILSR